MFCYDELYCKGIHIRSQAPMHEKYKFTTIIIDFIDNLAAGIVPVTITQHITNSFTPLRIDSCKVITQASIRIIRRTFY